MRLVGQICAGARKRLSETGSQLRVKRLRMRLEGQLCVKRLRLRPPSTFVCKETESETVRTIVCEETGTRVRLERQLCKTEETE